MTNTAFCLESRLDFGGDASECAFSGGLLHGCLFEKLRGFGWIDVFLRTEVYSLPLFFWALLCIMVQSGSSDGWRRS